MMLNPGGPLFVARSVLIHVSLLVLTISATYNARWPALKVLSGSAAGLALTSLILLLIDLGI